MSGHPENLLLSYEPRYCPPSQLVAAMRRATSHTQLRLLLAGVAVACLALPALRVPAQPQRAVPPQRPLPPSRDGSHDFDFLEGTWQISEAPGDYFTRGPFGRLVARIPAPRTATLEWYTREPDTVADSGFVRMSYDSSSNQWMIQEAKSQTASPEPPLVGRFEHGIGSFIGPRERDGRKVLVRLTWTFNGLGSDASSGRSPRIPVSHGRSSAPWDSAERAPHLSHGHPSRERAVRASR